MDQQFSSLVLFAVLPVVLIVCVALNLFIRARGGRSVRLNLKAFGIELNIESTARRALEEDGSDNT